MEREQRNLDGILLRVRRGKEVLNLCMSDATEEELRRILRRKSKFWLQEACVYLAERIHSIGDELDLMGVDIDENQDKA